MSVRATQIYVSILRPLSGTVPQTVSDILGLTSGEDCFLVTLFRLATNTFAISVGGHQTATHQYVYGTCSNTFALLAACGVNPTMNVTQYLGFTVYNIQGASNTMFVTGPDSVPKGSVLNEVILADDLLQTIGMSNDVERAYIAANTILFSQTAFPIFPRECVDIFGFVDTADLTDSNYERDTTQTFVQQHLSYTINNGPCVQKNYRPFVGSSAASGYDEMEVTPPTLVSQTLTLQYPYPPLIGGGNTIFEFKNPTFGNNDRLQFTVIDRTTRGGDRIIYGDPKWAKAQVFEYEIVNVKRSVMEEFVTFVNLSLGKDIGLTDWFGQQFAGVIIAPESPILETVSGFTIRLRFQGVATTF